MLAAAAAAGGLVVATNSGPAGEARRGFSAAAPKAAFGQHYIGLVQRRQGAQVPTMMQTMSSPVHVHPLIKVFVNGKPRQIPASIGIDLEVDAMKMAGLHTHDTSGTIHVEGMPGATLGQFFAIWGVAFSADRLGPHRSDARTNVRMRVDGESSDAFGALKLANRQRIVISVGPSSAPPPR